jgi:pantoate--beta-alanine ligase
MRVVRSAMDRVSESRHGRPSRVGFVPTMGALHTGHTGLITRARSNGCDFVVSSIFVNPTQFAPHEDLSRYPRTWDTDVSQLTAHGAAAIFAPTASQMYPPTAPFRTFVTPRGVDEGTPEGAARPGFFRGVATVVLKLLNAVGPTEAWFGQKDGIQCIVVRGLVRDLNVPVAIHIGPTARHPDGLALSSRNVYLTPTQRAVAGGIYSSLLAAKEAFVPPPPPPPPPQPPSSMARGGGTGEEEGSEVRAQRAAFGDVPSLHPSSSPAAAVPLDPTLAEVKRVFEQGIARVGEFSGVEYCAFSDALTGTTITSVAQSQARGGAVMLSVVVKMGSVRLLDNIMLTGSIDDLGMPREVLQ